MFQPRNGTCCWVIGSPGSSGLFVNETLVPYIYVLGISINSRVDLMNLKTAKGLALRDVLSEVHVYVHKSKFISVQFT